MKKFEKITLFLIAILMLCLQAGCQEGKKGSKTKIADKTTKSQIKTASKVDNTANLSQPESPQSNAKIEFINKDVEIRINDEVVTSGLGAFPKSVHIGYISKISRDESGLFQSAEIVPRATVGLLDYVFVVSDPAPEGKR